MLGDRKDAVLIGSALFRETAFSLTSSVEVSGVVRASRQNAGPDQIGLRFQLRLGPPRRHRDPEELQERAASTQAESA